MKTPLLKSKWMRISGPLLSILLHVGAVFILLHTLGFASKAKQETVRIELAQPPDLKLDEILPIDPPEVEPDDALSPEPLSTEDISAMTPDQDLDVAPIDETIGMLDNLSPLVIQGIGADLSSQGALASKYGKRAVENGLLGTYFNRVDFTGESFMRIDATLNYKWELESPWPGRVKPELFSIIWTGRIVPPRSGVYTLYLQSDDGARLWIDGNLVLDQFVERQRQVDEVKIEMLVGKSYDIKYAFCDVFQHAISSLEWSCEEAGIERQLIPSEHMWADGKSTTQMLAWNTETARGQYGNRKLMRNPAMVEGRPYSQIVGFEKLDEEGIRRLKLEDQMEEFTSFKKSGRIPVSAQLPSIPHNIDNQQAEPAKNDDVKITIM